MKTNLSIFVQIIRLIPRDIIHKNVENHNSDFNSKGINAWTHLVSMLYCQFGNCQSIRDISFGLRSATGNLNHLGVSRAPSKSSISYINAHRGWTFFRDVYFSLFKEFNVKVHRIKLNRKLFILDSTLQSTEDILILIFFMIWTAPECFLLQEPKAIQIMTLISCWHYRRNLKISLVINKLCLLDSKPKTSIKNDYGWCR